MLTKLLEDIENGKDWEDEIFNIACQIAVSIAQTVFIKIDDEIFKQRDTKKLRSIGKRKRTIITRFGQLTINRHYVNDKEMNCNRFLLDEKLGIEKRKTISPKITSLSTILATLMPFRAANFAVNKLLPRNSSLSHQSIHTALQKEAKQYDEIQKAQTGALFENGEIAPNLKQEEVDTLFIESDGCWVHLQGEKEKDIEVKLAIAYEGLEKIAKDKYQTINKSVFGGNYTSEEFWKGFSTKLNYKYKLSKVKNFFLGGDGASWVKAGGAFFKNPKFYLDKFHQVQSLKRAFGFSSNKPAKALELIEASNFNEAINLLKGEKEDDPKKNEAIDKTIRYLTNNKNYLVKGSEVKGLGAMEGNVDKILATRLKKRGMSWSKSGVHSMIKMIEFRMNESIDSMLDHFLPKVDTGLKSAVRSAKIKVSQKQNQAPGDWLNKAIPALVGPHANRPWAKVLKEIVNS